MPTLTWPWSGSIHAWPVGGLGSRTWRGSKKKRLGSGPPSRRAGWAVAWGQRQWPVPQAGDEPAELLRPAQAAKTAGGGLRVGGGFGSAGAAVATTSGHAQGSSPAQG